MIPLIIICIIIIIIIILIIYYYKSVENFTSDITNSTKILNKEMNIDIVHENENNPNVLEETSLSPTDMLDSNPPENYQNEINKENIENIDNQNIENINKLNNINMNNLIKNGNFENGKNSLNHINQSGYNKIIVKKNPGKSSYVLEQRKTESLTYYELQCDSDKNNKYNLYFWLSVNKSNIDELDFNKLINIKFQNEDFSNYIPRLTFNIVQKIILSNNDDNSWFLIKYDFVSGPNTNNKMNIYLNYSDNLQYNEYYFTDLSLYKVLIDAENFTYNNKLICYVDGYNYQANIPTWHDLSGNGNDIFWSNIPISDLSIGSLTTLNQKIVGFPSSLISNKEFSILFCLNKIIENSASDDAVEEKNSIKDFYLISLPGNDRYAFEIQLKGNHLCLCHGKNKIISKNELTLFNKSLLSIIYDGNTLNIYLDGGNVLSHKIGKIYMTNDTFVINKNKNLNYNLYSVLFYNKIVTKHELNGIRDYFIQNKDKNFSTPDINKHHMFNTADFTINNLNLNESNKIFKGYNKRESKNESIDYQFFDTFDNRNYKEHCLSDCDKLCNIFSEKGECISNCNKVLLSCQRFCDDPKNSNSILCIKNNSNNNNSNNNNSNNIKCPEVYKKNGNYMVYVQPNSTYAQKYNYSGDRSYGNNREKAKYTYNVNFPNCPIPPELLPNEGKHYTENCPYIIDELNPCYTSACAGVNWNTKNYQDMNINDTCKKAVSNYCQINYKIDDNCYCWDPANKNSPECISYRRHFENPNDYCSPNQFKIEEHPDFNQYIKKDNIPCWGCKL